MLPSNDDKCPVESETRVTCAACFAVGSFVPSTAISGPFVTTLVQYFKPNFTQLYRVYNDGSLDPSSQLDFGFVELTYALGTIDDGYEVITLFNTDLKTGGSGSFRTVSIVYRVPCAITPL